jgi:diguanylate cyclase (GGDEF)-like protein/PAS domain S-box-containing protein
VKRFSRWSVRTKLVAVISAFIGLISLAIFIDVPVRLRRQAVTSVVEKTHALTEMAAFNVGAALYFEDRVGVAESLAAVRANADLVYIVVFDQSGHVLESFNRELAERYGFEEIVMTPRARGGGPPGAPLPRTEGGFSSDDRIYQARSPVTYNGRGVGRIYLGLSLDRLNTEVGRSRATIALVSLLIFVIGMITVFALSTVVTEPLGRIVKTAQLIAAGDLSSRAPVRFDDEVGRLARSFNEMVDKLGTAQRELADLNRDLERRVDVRTRELKGEIEDRKRVEKALRLSEERYRLLIERNLAGVYVTTEEGRVLTCNDAFARLLGYESGRGLLEEEGSFPYFDAGDRTRLLKRLRQEGAVSNREVRLQDREGQAVWALENVRLVEGDAGEPAILEGILLDITDHKLAEQETEHRALHDALTQLPNRTLLNDRIEVALAMARRAGVIPAIMFLDVDELKVINDTLGHATGDQLLRMVAERLTGSLREEDTVARVGGDEFTVLLPVVASEEAAVDVARKILERLSEPYIVGGDELHVTVSIGVAIFPKHGDSPDRLLKSADGAMYGVKVAGGNGVQVSSQLADRKALGRLSLEEELRRALEHEEFELHYQPQVDLETRSITGIEALVRWRHPDQVLIEPAGFISLAEYTGLIIPIGEWILYEACRQMKEWQNAGLPSMRVAVNISARQFYQRDFIGVIDRILRRAGLEAGRLELEITESLAMQKSDWSIRMLEKLKEMGVSIALDDFGTGQSSLSYLRRFPIDTLKIDQTFVLDLTKNTSVDSIVIATLLLANRIGLRTVAEGVETEGQFQFLKEFGCKEFQGYLFSRPLPAEALERQYFGPLMAKQDLKGS